MSKMTKVNKIVYVDLSEDVQWALLGNGTLMVNEKYREVCL